MKRVYLYGLGKGRKYAERCLKKEQIQICAYIDNYKAEKEEGAGHIPIIKSTELRDDFDYIIITLMQYRQIKGELASQGTDSEKIICFFSFDDADNERYWEVIDVFQWRSELMWRSYVDKTLPIIHNYGYELYHNNMLKTNDIPKILSADEAIASIRERHRSLARFGDNEFELMLGRKRTDYQDTDARLRKRLTEVLHSETDNVLIAIADNYGSLEKYTDEAADAIREYLGGGAREEHMRLLDKDREYYDAYLSRPYMIFRDKENANKRFDALKAIWDGQDILMVEGEHTRFGVGNDLLDNAKSVQRILTLDRSCFFLYDDLLGRVKQFGRDKLVLIALGPAASVMAYDLAAENYWAVDIGQLDVEYEWYLRKVKERCVIPYKTVSEVSRYEPIETDEDADYIKKYKGEIIAAVMK